MVDGVITSGCPMGMVCLSQAGAVGLAEYIGATRTWVLMAWAQCGPMPKQAPASSKPGSFGDPP